MSTKRPSPTRLGRVVGQAYDGVKAELKDGLSFSVGGVTYTTAELIAKLASYESLFTAARDDKLALETSLKARDQALPELATFLTSLHAALIGVYGPESSELVKFGFKPRKKAAPLTSEQALARATKAKATRAKRGTLGSKQKAAVKATGTPIITAVMPGAAESSLASGSLAEPGAPSVAASGGS